MAASAREAHGEADAGGAGPGQVSSCLVLHIEAMAYAAALVRASQCSCRWADVLSNCALMASNASRRRARCEQNMTHVSNASRQRARCEQNMTHVSNALSCGCWPAQVAERSTGMYFLPFQTNELVIQQGHMLKELREMLKAQK
jgi:hypothetical protein